MSVTRRRDSAERPGGAARRGNLNFGLRLGLELQVHWPKPESRSQLKITQAAGITRVTGITRVKVIFQSLRVTARAKARVPEPPPSQLPRLAKGRATVTIGYSHARQRHGWRAADLFSH